MAPQRLKLYILGLVLPIMGIVIPLYVHSSAAQAQTVSKVFLQQVTVDHQLIVLDVVAQDISNLFGFELQIKFDPEVVTVVDIDYQQEGVQIQNGDFLPVKNGFVVVNNADSQKGFVHYAMTMLNPALPVSGSGSLAKITFNILKNEATSIEISQANLVNHNALSIPVETTPFLVEKVHTLPQSGTTSSDVNQGHSEVSLQIADQETPILTSVALNRQAEPVDAAVSNLPILNEQPPSTNKLSFLSDANRFQWWVMGAVIIIIGGVSLMVLIFSTTLVHSPDG